MPVTFTKDSLRASLEASSGGRMTVLYNDKGHPIYCAVIPKFNLEDVEPSGDLGTGTHPAFIYNGAVKDKLFYGLFPAGVRDGRAVCLPGVDPEMYTDYDQAVSYCTANGPGWHLSTIFEWSAFKMWCMANGFQPRGNTDYGRHHDQLHETGVRQDDYPIGSSDGNARTLTGSGPKSWRHDQSPFGVADLVGNVWEWQHLFKIQDGQIIMPSDNYYDLDEANWTARGSYFDDPAGTLTIANSVGTTGSGGADSWTDITVAAGHTFENPVLQAGLTPFVDGDATSIIDLYSGILGKIYVF